MIQANTAATITPQLKSDRCTHGDASIRGCRFCNQPLTHTFVDLGMSPLCESYISTQTSNQMEPFYPLRAYVCDNCFLVQLHEYVSGEDIFSDYAYFSSYSDSWLAHCRRYTQQMIERFNIDSDSQVIEIASNDGYLLQYFVEQDVPALGIEPAANVAEVAEAKGVPTRVRFFGRETAQELVDEGVQPDLLLGNNVLAHVPDLNDFVAGMKILLKDSGAITMEFPHLMRLMEGNQFDTIYHEHFCYFSFMTVRQVFAEHGLTIFDVDELPTHGGSLRIYARHDDNHAYPVTDAVTDLLACEQTAGFNDLQTYRDFAERVRETKRKLLSFLIDARRDGKHIVGYGAPGKGNTLLNYCGIREDFIDYVVDRNPIKQGKFLPGTRIPIFDPQHIDETKPDYVIIMPWNIKDEIVKQLDHVRQWGAKFVVAIPELTVID